MIAVREGHVKIASQLIDSGANINIQDRVSECVILCLRLVSMKLILLFLSLTHTLPIQI